MEKKYLVVVEQKVIFSESLNGKELSTPEVKVRKAVFPVSESREEAEENAYQIAREFIWYANVLWYGIDPDKTRLPAKSKDAIYEIEVTDKYEPLSDDKTMGLKISWRIYVSE